MSKIIKIVITELNNREIVEVNTINLIAGKGVIGDRHFKDYNDPYNHLSIIESVIIVSDIVVFDKLSKLAKDSFKALGGKSLGRIDIKMDHLGIPHFIEANLMPGLRKGYFYRSCVLNLDMSYEDMIFSIANTGLSSH